MGEVKYYVCTNCGISIGELYKQFGGVALKLTKCVRYKMSQNISLYTITFIFQENCNWIADKYLEYDLINVIIDLILLRIVAIRHFLFNSTYTVGNKI